MADDLQERVEDLALGGKGSGKSRRGGRGGGGGSGGSGPSRQVQISKALSTLLRHQAQNAGIQLDEEGFAPLDRVMQWPRLRNLKPTLPEIKDEVATNAKQRFSMKPNPPTSGVSEDDASHWLIRANQGHSIAVASEGLHTPITLEAGNLPEVIVHGTYFAFWPLIVSGGGLKKMGRTHVHFGTGVPDDQSDENKVISGMRGDAEVLIFVDLEKALREEPGIKWWLSENQVVLTEGNEEGVVPLKYFKEVRGRRQGVGLLWKEGEKVADLPEGIVARVPQGKSRGERGGRRGGRGRGGS